MTLLRIQLRDYPEPSLVEDERRVEVVVLAGPDQGGRVRLELAVDAELAVLCVAVHDAVHGLHLEDALDGVPGADMGIVSDLRTLISKSDPEISRYEIGSDEYVERYIIPL